MISGFLRDFRVLIQSSVFAVIFVFAVSGGGPGAAAARAGRGLFCVVVVAAPPPPPHLVLGECCVCEWARFLDIAILGNAVFLEYCVFLKRAIFEKALYDFMRVEG